MLVGLLLSPKLWLVCVFFLPVAPGIPIFYSLGAIVSIFAITGVIVIIVFFVIFRFNSAIRVIPSYTVVDSSGIWYSSFIMYIGVNSVLVLLFLVVVPIDPCIDIDKFSWLIWRYIHLFDGIVLVFVVVSGRGAMQDICIGAGGSRGCIIL